VTDTWIAWLIALDFGEVPMVVLARRIAKADREENAGIAQYVAQRARREIA
jgi:hypothetical protein